MSKTFHAVDAKFTEIREKGERGMKRKMIRK
jgi:hypothetical protein